MVAQSDVEGGVAQAGGAEGGATGTGGAEGGATGTGGAEGEAAETGAAELSRLGLLPDVLLEHTSCALGRLGQALIRLIDQRLAAFGIRSRHVGVLLALRATAGGPLSQQALGTYLAIDPATMVAIVNEFEERGLVRRERDDGDARRHAVTITEPGQAFLEQAEQVLDGIDDEVLVVLAPRLQRALAEAVRQLATSPQVASVAEVARGVSRSG